MQMHEKVGKSQNSVFFQWFVAPEGRKVGSLKRRVPSHLARWEMKNCTPLWHEANFKIKMYKAHHSRSTFGSWDVEKVHAVVARSTFRSQNLQNTPFSDHFWKFRCRKSARCCGAKHISKSTCTKHRKHTMFGPLLEVAMSKKCTPLWCEAHFEVKMYKAHHSRTTFGSCDVERVHAVVARSTFRSEHVRHTRVRTTFGSSDDVLCGRRKRWCTLSKVSKTWGFCNIFNYNHHYTTLHSNTLHYNNYTFITFHCTTLHSTTLHYAQLHSSTLHCTTLHYVPLHYTTLRYTTLHYTPLYYTTLHSTTLHYITLQSTTLHYNHTTLHSTTLHYTPLHSTTLHYTQLHYTTLHYTTIRSTTLQYTTLHSTTLH